MSDRDQFEKHYRETRGARDHDFQKLNNEKYFYSEIQSDWELWQAAIATLGRDELLAACDQCLRHIEQDESMHGRPFAAGNVARAAIKKARGEA